MKCHIVVALLILVGYFSPSSLQAFQLEDNREHAVMAGITAGVINGLLNKLPVNSENKYDQQTFYAMSMLGSHCLYYRLFSGMNNVLALWGHGFAQLFIDSYDPQERKIKKVELNTTLKLALLALIIQTLENR